MTLETEVSPWDRLHELASKDHRPELAGPKTRWGRPRGGFRSDSHNRYRYVRLLFGAEFCGNDALEACVKTIQLLRRDHVRALLRVEEE